MRNSDASRRPVRPDVVPAASRRTVPLPPEVREPAAPLAVVVKNFDLS
jgi:hypothetical protein